jgi:predicted transcriptional regulator
LVALELTARIASAYLCSNMLGVAEIPALLMQVHAALVSIEHSEEASDRPTPAVEIRHSVHRQYVVCLEDGKRFKMLRRHLTMTHGMSADEYRARWKLPQSHPIVAPA